MPCDTDPLCTIYVKNIRCETKVILLKNASVVQILDLWQILHEAKEYWLAMYCQQQTWTNIMCSKWFQRGPNDIVIRLCSLLSTTIAAPLHCLLYQGSSGHANTMFHLFSALINEIMESYWTVTFLWK